MTKREKRIRRFISEMDEKTGRRERMGKKLL